MASEIDSFVFKLKNLWKAGRNANLTIECNAGKASVNLRVDDLVVPHHALQQRNSRNGESQRRLRERRAQARQAAEEGAGEVTNIENTDANDLSDKENLGKITVGKVAEEATAAPPVNDGKGDSVLKGVAEKVSEDFPSNEKVEVEDEFCPDSDFSPVKAKKKNVQHSNFSRKEYLY